MPAPSAPVLSAAVSAQEVLCRRALMSATIRGPHAQVHSTDAELGAAKGRLQQVLDVLGLERDFKNLSHGVGQVSMCGKRPAPPCDACACALVLICAHSPAGACVLS